MREYKHDELYPHTTTLSSTELLDYIEDPSKFYESWVFPALRRETDPMFIGKVFSELYADRSYDWAKALKDRGITAPKIHERMREGIKRFPELPKECCEVEIYADVTGHDDWKVRVTLDGFLENSLTNIENKTGKAPWSQKRFDNSMQITAQSWAIWKKYGKKPSKNICNWLSFNDGTVHTWTSKRTMKQIREFDTLVSLAVENIKVGNFTRKI